MTTAVRRSRAAGSLLILAVTAAALGGCDDTVPRAIGPDVSYLDAPLKRDIPGEQGKTLLPLIRGTSWDMATFTRGSQWKDRLQVTGPITVDGVDGIEVKILREGKPWRREIYRVDQSKGQELQLVATQDENSGLMRYQPPIPLLRYPATEGDYLEWEGHFQLGKLYYPAHALSRVSGRETLRTPAGIFRTLRLDTVVEVTREDGPLRFPTVRWLAPGIGFVRRGFAEKGEPAFSDLTRFNIP